MESGLHKVDMPIIHVEMRRVRFSLEACLSIQSSSVGVGRPLPSSFARFVKLLERKEDNAALCLAGERNLNGECETTTQS